MQQSSTASDEIISPQVSPPSVSSQKDQPSTKTSQYGCPDKAYRDENIFSSFASVKLKLVHASNNHHDEEENDAAVSGPTGHRITPNRGQVSAGDHCAVVTRTTTFDASGHIFCVDQTAAFQTSDNESDVYNEVDDAVSLHEAVTPDEQGVAVDTRQADILPSEAAVSLNNTCTMGNRNPEFYSPTRKLDLTKKISNKSLSDPLPGDEEETVIVKKKQNPLKRLFARKKGKFDPMSGDVSQSELPGTDQEMSTQIKKHKFKMRIGKTKSREVLDLNSLSGVGSNLEIDQIQSTLATRNAHKPHSEKIIDSNSDINKTKHGEVSSKVKCKTRGKITKENIIVLKSTGKLLSDFGSASVDSASGPPVIDREKLVKETAKENENRESNGNSGQSDFNQQQHCIDDNNDEHSSTDDNSDDLQHLDDMLDHIYANFAFVDPGLSPRDQSHNGLHVSGGDESTGIDVTEQVGEITNDTASSSSGKMNMIYFDEKMQAGEINRGNVDDRAQAEEKDRGSSPGKEKAASGKDDTREISKGNFNDKVQAGDIVMRGEDDKVQAGDIVMRGEDDKDQSWETNVEKIDDKTQEDNLHRENTDDTVGYSAIGIENVYDTVQGLNEYTKYKEGNLSGEPRLKCIPVDKLQKGGRTVESEHDKLEGRKISEESLHDKLQGKEICIDNVNNKLQDQEFGRENSQNDQHGIKFPDYHVCNVDSDNRVMTEESKHLHSLGDSDLREDSVESVILSSEMDVNQKYNDAESHSAMERLSYSSVADRVDSLEKEMDSLAGDNGLRDFAVCGDHSRDVRVISLGVAAPNKLMLDTNIPDNVKDDPTYNCVENTSTGDDVFKSNIHTHFSAHFASTLTDVTDCQGAKVSDLVSDGLTNSSVITQDGVLQDTAVGVDGCQCFTSQPSASTQIDLCSPHSEPEDVSGDLDTNDIANLEITTDIPDTESPKNSEIERVCRHDQDGVDVSNVFIERFEEQNIEFYREIVTCTPSGDGIVWDHNRISVNGSGTAQSEIKRTRSDQSFNDLLLLPDKFTTDKDHVNLPGWQTQSVHNPLLSAAELNDRIRPVGELHDQLHTTGKLQAANIPQNLRKPPIKPKPHAVQSVLYTAQETTDNDQAKSGRHPLNSHRGVEDVVDDPAPNVQPGAVTFTSVECVKKDLAINWSEDLNKEDINEHCPDFVGGSSSGKMSRGNLQLHSGYVQEHHAVAESQVTEQLNENLSDDVNDGINISGHVSADVSDKINTSGHVSADVSDKINTSGHVSADVSDKINISGHVSADVSDKINISGHVSADVSDKINISGHVNDESNTNCHASADVRDKDNSNGHGTDDLTVDIDKLTCGPENQRGVNVLEKSGGQTLESRSTAGQEVHRSSSITSGHAINTDSRLSETIAGLSTNDVVHKNTSTRLPEDLGQTCEDTLQQRPDVSNGRFIDKREVKKSGNNSNSGITMEKGAGNSMLISESKDSFDLTETCLHDQKSTTYTRDTSTRDTSQADASTLNSDIPGTIKRDISRGGTSIQDSGTRDFATLDTSIRDTITRDKDTRDTITGDTESSNYYDYAGDKLTSDNTDEALGYAMNVNTEATGDKTFRSEASELPNKNIDNLSSTYELDSFESVYHREVDKDNIYDEISEDIYITDVSCLTSKRFQFPWKKKEKKLEKKGEINNSNSKEKGKLKPTKGKPAIKPKPVLKVSSECSKSRPHVHDDKTAKRRSGKVKRKSASFTLPSEESLYHEIDEDLWRRHDAMDDFTSSSSSTSDDDLSYEPINYTEKDGGNKEGEASSLPQEVREYKKSLLNSADSLGYEIPAKFSLKAMEPAGNNGTTGTSRVEYLFEQYSPSLNPGTKEVDGDSQLGLEPDSCSCEDLPVISQDINWASNQLQSSSLPTYMATSERLDSQTMLPVGVCAVNPPSQHEIVSGEDKSWKYGTENSGTCQTFARNQVSGFSIGNIAAEVASHGEITENRDSAGSQMTEGLTLGGGMKVPSVIPKSECSNAGCALSHDPSTCGDKEKSRERIGSSNSSDMEIERLSRENRIACETDHTEDGSGGSYDSCRLSENVTGDNFSRSNSGIDDKTTRLGDVAVSGDTKESGDRSTNVRLRTKVSLDTQSPQRQHLGRHLETHTPQRQQLVRDVETHTLQRQQSTPDVDTHTLRGQQPDRDVDTHTLQRQQSTPDVDKKVAMKVVNNREMLAGYNQVMKSLAALFVSNNDNENLHTELDNPSSLEPKCSETHANDFPKKVRMHDKQRGPQISTNMSIELHKVEAGTTHLQTTNWVSEREVELLPSKQIGSGKLFHGSQEKTSQDETQGHEQVLLSAARSQSNVPGWSHRKCFSLRDIHKNCVVNSATVTRSFDSRIYTESNSNDIRLEVFRRTSSLPKAFKPHDFKVTHCKIESGSLSVASSSQSIRTHNLNLHRQQGYMTESEEVIMTKAGELPVTACSSQGVNSDDTRRTPNNQARTIKHKVIPPIPVQVTSTTTRGTTHLKVPSEDEGDDKPEYDLPPIRAKRISQSRILSWPGLSVSGTTQPAIHTPALQPAERPVLAASNRAEYAAPWEGTGLESLGTSPPPYNTQSLTEAVHEAVSSPTADLDQLVKDGHLTSPSTGSLDRRFVVTLGTRGKPVHVGHDDVEATKMFGKKHRRLPSEDDDEETPTKKTSFLRMMASLFHRKKKTFNVHDDHPKGDEMSSASEEDSATFDFISAPHEVVSEVMPSHQRDSAASVDTKDALSSGELGESSVTSVTNVRPLCRLLKLNEDKTRTIEFIQPWLHYQGVSFTKDSQQSRAEGVFVAPFVDKGISKLLAGFLDVGDQVLEIDGLDVSSMSVDEINHLVQTKQQMTVTISPSNSGD